MTAAGSATEMGRIASMVTATKRTKSPLQRELDGMTKVFGTIAIVRIVPAAAALAGARLGWATVVLVAWFGPPGPGIGGV